MEGPLANRQHK